MTPGTEAAAKVAKAGVALRCNTECNTVRNESSPLAVKPKQREGVRCVKNNKKITIIIMLTADS